MKTVQQAGGRGRNWWIPRLLFAGVLLAGGLWVYQPALNRVFAADQTTYLAELDGETSLASGFRLLDYTAVRLYEKGDEVLYRPVLQAWLAIANKAFGRNFRAWNMAGLLIHLALAYLLFEVLWRLRRTWLAGGVALWFAGLTANFELVSWNHLSGYMLGYGLLVAALWAAREMGKDEVGLRFLWIYGIAMTGAVLVHEIAVIAGLGITVHGVWNRWGKSDAYRRRRILAWGTPLVVFAVLYVFHVAQCDRFLWVNPHMETATSPGLRAMALPALMGNWAVRILLPGHSLLATQAFSRSGWVWPSGGWGSSSMVAGALWIGLLACLRRGYSWRRLQENGAFAAGLAGLILAYAGMNWLGRSNASQVAYYVYLPALLATILVYSLMDLSRVGRKERIWALVFLLLLAATNGWQTYQISVSVHKANLYPSWFFGELEKAVRPRLSNPRFHFAVAPGPRELTLSRLVLVGYPDEETSVRLSMLSCLYGKHYNPAAAEVWTCPWPPLDLR